MELSLPPGSGRPLDWNAYDGLLRASRMIIPHPTTTAEIRNAKKGHDYYTSLGYGKSIEFVKGHFLDYSLVGPKRRMDFNDIPLPLPEARKTPKLPGSYRLRDLPLTGDQVFGIVPVVEDCATYYRSIATYVYGSERYWEIVKAQHIAYFRQVMGDRTHPRNVAYNNLNLFREARPHNDESDDRSDERYLGENNLDTRLLAHNDTLGENLWQHLNIPGSLPKAQFDPIGKGEGYGILTITADLYDIRLIVFEALSGKVNIAGDWNSPHVALWLLPESREFLLMVPVNEDDEPTDGFVWRMARHTFANTFDLLREQFAKMGIVNKGDARSADRNKLVHPWNYNAIVDDGLWPRVTPPIVDVLDLETTYWAVFDDDDFILDSIKAYLKIRTRDDKVHAIKYIPADVSPQSPQNTMRVNITNLRRILIARGIYVPEGKGNDYETLRDLERILQAHDAMEGPNRNAAPGNVRPHGNRRPLPPSALIDYHLSFYDPIENDERLVRELYERRTGKVDNTQDTKALLRFIASMDLSNGSWYSDVTHYQAKEEGDITPGRPPRFTASTPSSPAGDGAESGDNWYYGPGRSGVLPPDYPNYPDLEDSISDSDVPNFDDSLSDLGVGAMTLTTQTNNSPPAQAPPAQEQNQLTASTDWITLVSPEEQQALRSSTSQEISDLIDPNKKIAPHLVLNYLEMVEREAERRSMLGRARRILCFRDTVNDGDPYPTGPGESIGHLRRAIERDPRRYGSRYARITLEDVEQYDYIIILCVSDFRNTDQFSAIVVAPNQNFFTYLFPDPDQSAAPVGFQQYFQTLQAHLNAGHWKEEQFPHYARQESSADSGALVAAYVECIARNKPLNEFSVVADMRAIRFRMAHVLTQDVDRGFEREHRWKLEWIDPPREL